MSSEMWILEHSEPSARKLGPFTKTATQSHKHTIPAPKHSQHHGKGKSKQVEGERRDVEAQGDDSSGHSTRGQEMARGHLLCCGLCIPSWGKEGMTEQSPGRWSGLPPGSAFATVCFERLCDLM